MHVCPHLLGNVQTRGHMYSLAPTVNDRQTDKRKPRPSSRSGPPQSHSPGPRYAHTHALPCSGADGAQSPIPRPPAGVPAAFSGTRARPPPRATAPRPGPRPLPAPGHSPTPVALSAAGGARVARELAAPQPQLVRRVQPPLLRAPARPPLPAAGPRRPLRPCARPPRRLRGRRGRAPSLGA